MKKSSQLGKRICGYIELDDHENRHFFWTYPLNKHLQKDIDWQQQSRLFLIRLGSLCVAADWEKNFNFLIGPFILEVTFKSNFFVAHNCRRKLQPKVFQSAWNRLKSSSQLGPLCTLTMEELIWGHLGPCNFKTLRLLFWRISSLAVLVLEANLFDTRSYSVRTQAFLNALAQLDNNYSTSFVRNLFSVSIRVLNRRVEVLYTYLDTERARENILFTSMKRDLSSQNESRLHRKRSNR